MNRRSLIESGIVIVFALSLLGTSISIEKVYERQMHVEEIEAYCDALEAENNFLRSEVLTAEASLSECEKLQAEQTQEYNKNLAQMYGQLVDYYTPSNTIVYTTDDIILLAKVMQTEGGPKNYLAQEAIAQVVLNRVASDKFPNSIHDVVYQNDGKIQFAVAYDGSLDKCELDPRIAIHAMRILSEQSIYPDNLLYFCADPINFDSYATFYAEIEGTKFYTR